MHAENCLVVIHYKVVTSIVAKGFGYSSAATDTLGGERQRRQESFCLGSELLWFVVIHTILLYYFTLRFFGLFGSPGISIARRFKWKWGRI